MGLVTRVGPGLQATNAMPPNLAMSEIFDSLCMDTNDDMMTPTADIFLWNGL